MPPVLTKFYDQQDLHAHDLRELLDVNVDWHFKEATPQHPARRWEYAMALRAVNEKYAGPGERSWVDVGGADSPFSLMAEHCLGYGTGTVIDPRGGTGTLREWVAAGGRAEHVFCISTIEHVDTLPIFLEDLAAATASGGMLFLTSDAWDQEGEDKAHWHWDRKRIWTKETWHRLQLKMFELGFQPLGGIDLTWNGQTLENWGYTLVSMALRKV